MSEPFWCREFVAISQITPLSPNHGENAVVTPLTVNPSVKIAEFVSAVTVKIALKNKFGLHAITPPTFQGLEYVDYWKQ